MVRVAVVGFGSMGSTHTRIYQRLEEEGCGVKLVAICDVDAEKLRGIFRKGKFGQVEPDFDLSMYQHYQDFDEMLEKEALDYVDITLPTYLHAEYAVRAMEKGKNVLCEKPMALNAAQCQTMIDASLRTGKQLMIAQCLRFWPAYLVLKEYVDSGKLGKCVGGYFFRGGGTPMWSYENWLLRKECAGGALLDQHIHDVDTIQWLFGMPKAVSSVGRNVIEGSGYDVVSTNYIFDDPKAVNAQDDWVLNGAYGFSMLYRVNFEKGNIVFEKGKVTVNPNDGPALTPELEPDNGYYYEIKYFIDCLKSGKPVDRCLPESTRDTILIAEGEIKSCDNGGAPVYF